MPEIRLALEAMRTRFELLLVGAEPLGLRAAGEAALREVRAAEQELSYFRSDSALSRLNREAPSGWTRPPERAFRLLADCRRWHEESRGAFDPAFRSAPFCGFAAVEFDEARGAVRFADRRVTLDLGAVGKGEALDRAAEVLREHGVDKALLHGGTSSVLAIGAPSGERGWRVGIAEHASALLRDAALGVSGSRRLHIRDPRTGGMLVDAPRAAAVVAPTAAAADALSTALLVASGAEFSFDCRLPT